MAVPGVRSRSRSGRRFPVWPFFFVSVARALRFQLPPVEPCMRFSRTRLTDVVHRRHSVFSRQAWKGLGATTVPVKADQAELVR